jgi:hypothetical protein
MAKPKKPADVLGVANTLLDRTLRGFPYGVYRAVRIAPVGRNTPRLAVVEVPPLNERIRELCSKAATAKDSEVEAILSELQAALRKHTKFVRQMAAPMLNRESKKRSQAA